jgi:hypothetical protein
VFVCLCACVRMCSPALCPLDTPHKERAYAWRYCMNHFVTNAGWPLSVVRSLSVRLSLSVSVSLPLRLSVSPSLRLSVSLSLPVCLSVCLCLSLYLSVPLFLRPSHSTSYIAACLLVFIPHSLPPPCLPPSDGEKVLMSLVLADGRVGCCWGRAENRYTHTHGRARARARAHPWDDASVRPNACVGVGGWVGGG